MTIALVLFAVFFISWIVSTPEGRAAAKPGIDRLGKRLLAIEAVLIAAVWIYASVRG